MSSVKKAIIPAAGFGTRLLPFTKSIPKEMVPILNKPLIHYIVEEAQRAGIEEILFITRADKRALQEYFDKNVALEHALEKNLKYDVLEGDVKAIGSNIQLAFIPQNEPKGLGDAILKAKFFIKEDEPFVILLPDVLYDINQENPTETLVKKYQEKPANYLLTHPLPMELVHKYGIALFNEDQKILELVEKPSLEQAPSNHAITGRYLMHGSIMPLLEKVVPQKNNEIQLTDALQAYSKCEPMYAVSSRSQHFDCGALEGFLDANIHFDARRRKYNGRIFNSLSHQKMSNVNANFQRQKSVPDNARLKQFHFHDITVDFSPQKMNKDTVAMLASLANNSALQQKIADLFDGKNVDLSEQRPALHTALRGSYAQCGEAVTSAIEQAKHRLKVISDAIRNKEWKGYSGKPIQHIVHIGVGGSHLGPKLLLDALSGFRQKDINIEFVSNTDPMDLEQTLRHVDLDETLFIVASKSFTTEETLLNFSAIQGLYPDESSAMAHHFIAITANPSLAQDRGFTHILPIWEWVGGRYSVWSSVSLAAIIGIGIDQFEGFLQGAKDMDRHFKTEPFASNIPVLLGLLDVWNINFKHAESHAIIPYARNLRYLVPYLSQLYMESLGKDHDNEGKKIRYKTGSVIWGDVGTNSQHSFHQMLMQGTHTIPVDFILIERSYAKNQASHDRLNQNCHAQIEALTEGHHDKDNGLKDVNGNKPCILLRLQALTPHALGALLSLFEHRVYTQAVIWNINPFDQFGVELSKTILRTQEELAETSPKQTENVKHEDKTNV